MKTIILICALVATLALHSTIINIPADYNTIQAGIDSSADADTVLVQPGTYNENVNFNGKNVTVASLYLTMQDTSYISQTIIDGNDAASVVTFESGEDSTAVITGFTLQNGFNWDTGGGIYCDSSNPKILSNIIKDNQSDSGGGIYCSSSNAKILYNNIHHNTYMSVLGTPGGGISCLEGSDCIIMYNSIHHNQNQDGSGIAVYNSDAVVSNNLIYENEAWDNGGGMRCMNGDIIITNNTFWANTAQEAGGIYVDGGCNLTIVNNIFWENISQEGGVFLGGPIVTYSDVEGGYAGIGNIDEDPLFVDPENYDFHLQENSPCINAGDPALPLDPDGTISDMGALYFQQGLLANFEADVTSGEIPLVVQFTDLSIPNQNPITSWEWDFDNNGTVDSDEQNPTYTYSEAGSYTVSLAVNDGSNSDSETKVDYINVSATGVEGETISLETILLSNYPNPFNPTTTISFSLITEDIKDAKLEIYNLKGQKIRQYPLFNNQSSIVWDGKNDVGNSVTSGVYFYKMKAGGRYTSSKKMILLK